MLKLTFLKFSRKFVGFRGFEDSLKPKLFLQIMCAGMLRPCKRRSGAPQPVRHALWPDVKKEFGVFAASQVREALLVPNT